MGIKSSASDQWFKVLAYCSVGAAAILCLLPLLITLAVSFSNESLVVRHGYKLIPEQFSTETYDFILRSGNNWLLRSYGLSALVTLAGTAASLAATSLLAYGLALKTVRYRQGISFFCYFTMLFSGGLVPWYIVCVNFYHLSNAFISLFLPYLVSVFLLLVLKSFFSSIPESLIESARLDGASDFTIYTRIVLPVSQTAMVTVGLFYGLQYWNDWFLPLMLVTDSNLYTIQYKLYTILSNTQGLSAGMAQAAAGTKVPTETVKMATTVLTVVPIMCVYPFVQRYFVKGLTIGAVKG
jgi:putative aldouronate transport system permease protein